MRQDDIKRLGEELLADPIRYSNHAGKFLKVMKDSTGDEEDAREAIRALQLFISDSMSSGDLSSGRKQDTDLASATHKEWLRRQHRAFQDSLLQACASPKSTELKLTAFTAMLDLARSDRAKTFESETFSAALEAMICSPHTSEELLNTFAGNFADYCDIRYFIFRAIHHVVNRASSSQDEADEHLGSEPNDQVPLKDIVPRNVFILLSRLKPFSNEPRADQKTEEDAEKRESMSWCGALERGEVQLSTMSEGPKLRKKRQRQQATEEADDKEGQYSTREAKHRRQCKWITPYFQKKAFSEAWLAFFRMQLPEDVFRKALVRVHENVIPHMSNPHLLADLFNGALDNGGLLGILALHAIFVLVTKYGLEYPHFYARLYQLLQPDSLLTRHRTRFFQLADIFLSSQLVPAYTMAAFAKRFARLALTAHPAGAMLCLAFIHNILRRHRACNVLVNRASSEEGTSSAAADPYIDHEADPAGSRALESSLWEVKSLCNHYYVQVAVLAKQILDKDLTDRKKTAELDIAPMLGGSYTSLLTGEVNRRIKQVSTAFYQTIPTKLFSSNGTPEFASWAY